MGSVLRFALGAAFALGAPFAMVATPAGAAPADQGPTLSKPERAALAALETALAARDYSAATTALGTARSVAQGSDARYYVAVLQLRLARETNNATLQASAMEALAASGRMSGAELGAYYAATGGTAANAGSRERAETELTRAMELAPSADTAIGLAQVKLSLRKNQEGITLLERAIALRQATGVPVPEAWFRRGAELSTASNLPAQALRFTRGLVAAYPTRENWRDAILTYRDFAKPDPSGQLDAARLLRLAKGLSGERDYLEAANTFDAAGLAGESRSVLEEGVSTKMVDPAKTAFKDVMVASAKKAAAEKPQLAGLQARALAGTSGTDALRAGDLYLGAANYSAAADLFRAAAQKGGVDPGVANIRLGTALALAGRNAEAEAALRTVTGPRADLAALWLIWLGQRG
jgi:hypothetical protein